MEKQRQRIANFVNTLLDEKVNDEQSSLILGLNPMSTDGTNDYKCNNYDTLSCATNDSTCVNYKGCGYSKNNYNCTNKEAPGGGLTNIIEDKCRKNFFMC